MLLRRVQRRMSVCGVDGLSEYLERLRADPDEPGRAPASVQSLAALAQRLLLEEYAPAAVLVNRKYEILYFFGPTMSFLDQPPRGADPRPAGHGPRGPAYQAACSLPQGAARA
jgi:hypothetical protein